MRIVTLVVDRKIGRHEVILTGILLPNSCWVRIGDGLGKDRRRVVITGIFWVSRLILWEGCSLLGGSTSLSDVSSKGVNNVVEKAWGGGEWLH